MCARARAKFDVRDLGIWYIFIVSTERGDSDE